MAAGRLRRGREARVRRLSVESLSARKASCGLKPPSTAQPGECVIPQKASWPVLTEPDHNTSHTPPWEKRRNE